MQLVRIAEGQRNYRRDRGLLAHTDASTYFLHFRLAKLEELNDGVLAFETQSPLAALYVTYARVIKKAP